MAVAVDALFGNQLALTEPDLLTGSLPELKAICVETSSQLRLVWQ